MNEVEQELLQNSPAAVLQITASCSDCSIAPGIAT